MPPAFGPPCCAAYSFRAQAECFLDLGARYSLLPRARAPLSTFPAPRLLLLPAHRRLHAAVNIPAVAGLLPSVTVCVRLSCAGLPRSRASRRARHFRDSRLLPAQLGPRAIPFCADFPCARVNTWGRRPGVLGIHILRARPRHTCAQTRDVVRFPRLVSFGV